MKHFQLTALLVILAASPLPTSLIWAHEETASTVLSSGKAKSSPQKPQKQSSVLTSSRATLLIIQPSEASRAAQRKRSHDFLAALELGEKALASGRSDKAIEAFQLARQIEPYEFLALQRLAEAYTANRQPEQAIATYRALIYPAPGQDWSSSNQVSPTVLMNYSLLLLQTGQEQEALAMYNRALTYLNYDQGKPSLEVLIPEIGPNGLPYSAQLLQAMDCLGIGIDTPGFDGTRLKEAVKLAPESAVANFYLGKYLYARPEPGAKVVLEKAIQLGDSKTIEAARKYLQFCQ